MDRQAIQSLLGRPVAFHRVFVTLTGSVTAAIMLSQAIYWQGVAEGQDKAWFYKTREQWEAETGLSRWEQEGARKALRSASKDNPFWIEQQYGMDRKLWYRVDFEALWDALTECLKAEKAGRKNLPSNGGKPSYPSEEKPPMEERKNLPCLPISTETTTENTSETTVGKTTKKPSPYSKNSPSPKTPPQPPASGAVVELLKAYRRGLGAKSDEPTNSELDAYGPRMRQAAKAGITPEQIEEATRAAKDWPRHMVNPRSVANNLPALLDKSAGVQLKCTPSTKTAIEFVPRGFDEDDDDEPKQNDGRRTEALDAGEAGKYPRLGHVPDYTFEEAAAFLPSPWD